MICQSVWQARATYLFYHLQHFLLFCGYQVNMIELMITCLSLYLLYLCCEVKYMVVKVGALVVRHDKQERRPTDFGRERPEPVAPSRPSLCFPTVNKHPEKGQQAKKKSKSSQKGTTKNKSVDKNVQTQSQSNDKEVHEIKKQCYKLLHTFST